MAMTSGEIPVKPRRKKLEVGVHSKMPDGNNDGIGTANKKTFSANFNSRKSKIKQHESETEPLSLRLSRRHLSKENARLAKENEEIVAKFNELEELSLRKILKLKEKISSLQDSNELILNQNESFKKHIEDLLRNIDILKGELEISRNCKNCHDLQECLEKFSQDNKELRANKKDLEDDLNMLKTVVFRLNLQMERYQEKLRNSPPQNLPSSPINQAQTIDILTTDQDFKILAESHRDHSHTPISWGKVNIHTLGPLLDAYQDTISEKEEIIQNYEKELSNFTGKLKDIIKENERLHKALTEDDECSTKLKQEMDLLRHDLKCVKEQNDILIKKCAVKQDKLDEVLKCYEAKVEQLKRDYSVVHEQYYKSRTEVTALREKNKALVDAQDDFRSERQNYIPLSVHSSSVNECRKWYEELKAQYEQEKTKQAKVVEEQQLKINNLTKDNEDLENKVKQLEKHIKKGETKFLELEHSLNEVQLSRSACRKQLHKAMGFAKDLVAEQETLLKALNQRQHENKVVKKFGTDIATRMDSLKNQLKDVQRDAWQELSTVEKVMQEQRDAIENMKQEHCVEIERLQQIIREQEESNLLLKEQTTLPVQQYLLFREKHK